MTLAQRINTIDRRVRAIHQDFSSRVENVAERNQYAHRADPQTQSEDRHDRRGRRHRQRRGATAQPTQRALKQLAEIANITVNEQPTVRSTFRSTARCLFRGHTTGGHSALSTKMACTHRDSLCRQRQSLVVSGGELHGIYESRDTILTGSWTVSTISPRRWHSNSTSLFPGRRKIGFQFAHSVERVDDPNAALNARARLHAGERAASLQRTKRRTGTTDSHDDSSISTAWTDDTTLASLASTIDAIDGVSARSPSTTSW